MERALPNVVRSLNGHSVNEDVKPPKLTVEGRNRCGLGKPVLAFGKTLDLSLFTWAGWRTVPRAE
jgi:hypothetical protein